MKFHIKLIFFKPLLFSWCCEPGEPVLPGMEGEAATLYCRIQSVPAVPAIFYNDCIFIASNSIGNMSIHNFAKSHEGLYMCNISGAGESPRSWLYINNMCKYIK